MASAAAALAGLLFVAVSINLADILKYPSLPRRAFETLLIMLGVVFVSIFALTPGQSTLMLGLEILTVGLVLGLPTLIPRLRMSRSMTGDELKRTVVPLVMLALSFIPMIVAGLSLVVGSGGGLYWLVPSLLASFTAAITSAWVLLVEILR